LTEAVAIISFGGFTRLQTDKKAMVKAALIDGAYHVLLNAGIASIILICMVLLCGLIVIKFQRGNENAFYAILVLLVMISIGVLPMYILYTVLVPLFRRLYSGFVAAKKR
jgi:hypothetical protein